MRPYRLLLTVPALLSLVAWGQPTSLVAQSKAQAEERGRAEVADLLRVLCPEQCVLLSIEARVDEETLSDAPPGFEQISPTAKVPVIRQITATLAADSELPGPFRSKLKSLVSARLKNVGGQPTVNIDALKFPPRNAPHLEKQPPEPKPEPEKPEEPLPPPLSAAERLQEKLVENAPLLAIVLFLGIVVLVVAALLAMAVKKASQPPAYDPYAYPMDAPVDAAAAAAAEAQAQQEKEKEKAAKVEQKPPVPALIPFSPARERKLENALREERTARNQVVREALLRGEVALVARWAREFGDVVLEDVRPDSTPADVIRSVASELTKPEPNDPMARHAALLELEGRMVGARLLLAVDSAEQAFAFLQGVAPERFASAFALLGGTSREIALRFAPVEHRSAALRILPATERAALAIATAKQVDVSVRSAHGVAAELREQLAQLTGSPRQAEAVLSDLLDTLSPQSQEEVVERLRDEGDGRLTQSLVTESTVQRAPADVLGSAVLGLAPAKLVTYLAGSTPELRDHVLAACPARLRRELRDELELVARPLEPEVASARRELIASLRGELQRRGISVAELEPVSNGKDTARA